MSLVRVHDVVQVNESHKWCGSFVYVTEVKDWGIQGFVQIPLQGQAFIRLAHDEYEIIGQTVLQLNLKEN